MRFGELDSKALTKIQTVALVAVIVVAGLAGAAAYAILSGQDQASETIKIGICNDIDMLGRFVWEGAILAAEQVNAEGGVLGRQFEIVAEDDDSNTFPIDVNIATSALNRLIAVDKADFILNAWAIPFAAQDICADHKVILFSQHSEEDLTQRVVDDYDRYKGFFRAGTGNDTSTVSGIVDSILTLRNYTGFNKIAYLIANNPSFEEIYSEIATSLQEQGFDNVYENTCPGDTVDYSSYFAAIEASGAEILVPFLGGVAFVKEYHDRQSPFVVWGSVFLAENIDFWNMTEGKCEFVTSYGYPVIAGYPLTSKTLPTREAFIDRWGKITSVDAAQAYDLVRFILPDAIRRAGTIEYEAVIAALEETDIETSLARRFVFTSDHDIMVGAAGPNRPGEDYMLVCHFQWQDGKQVIVYPKELMEEAGATYTYPDWPGPWD